MSRADLSLPAPVESRLQRILLAAISVTPFVVLPDFLYPFVVPRAAWFRVLVAVGLMVLTWQWSRGSWRPEPGAWRRERVGLGLAAFTAAVTVAAALGGNPLQGLLGSLVRMDGAVAWIGYLVFFLLLRGMLDRESWLPFLRLTAVVGVAVTLWALLQAHGDVLFGVAMFGWDAARLVGPVGLEGPLAAYLLLAAAVAGYLASRAQSRAARLGWTVVVAMELWTVALTGTRAALVGSIAAALLLGAWAAMDAGRRSRVQRLAVGGLAVVAVTVAAIALLGARTFPGLERLLDLGPDALSTRLPLWRAAWSSFLEHPLLGAGPESFDLVFDRHFRPSDYLAAGQAHHDRAHNVLLGALAETGIVGLVAYLIFWAAGLGAVVWALRRSEDEPGLLWLAGGVLAYFVYLLLWFEEITSFHLLLIIMAFLEHRRMAEEASTATEESEDASDAPAAGGIREAVVRGPKRYLGVGAAVLLVVGTAWSQGQALGVAYDTRAAMSAREPLGPFPHLEQALARPLTGEAQINSRYAVALNGLSGLLQRGGVELDSNSVSQAFHGGEKAVRRQLRREETNSVVQARLAMVYSARWQWSRDPADFRQAMEAYRRALEISPGRIRYLHQIARLHSQRGDAGRAMEVLAEAMDRLPEWWETYDTMARVQWHAGNREESVGWLLRAARTDVRWKTRGTSSQFLVRAGAWLEARGTPMEAVELFEAYLATRYPGWTEDDGAGAEDVPEAALPIAARLPITLMHAGRIEAARGAARRLRERLPPHLRRPAVTDRLDRFLEDMASGRTGPWTEAWGVLPTDVPLGG